MKRDEFERNRRRFGDAVGAWPAPFRQEARAFLADEEATDPTLRGNPDQALDRLVLEAALTEIDEQALARAVLARIDAGRARSTFLPGFFLAPAGLAASAAAIVVAATLAGYQVAGLQDDQADSELLALASGAGLSDDLVPGNGVPGIAADPGEQEDSL